MHTAFVKINNVPTKVITWGKWIEESFNPGDTRDIILCIPGNPGVTDFYVPFLQKLHELTGYSVWIIGHAGHELPENKNTHEFPSIKENGGGLYDLNGQINHKIEFIQKYIPSDAKVHLIGHSVGAYIISQLLKDANINVKVKNAYLLFPTIEYIGDTPNGKFWTGIVTHITKLICLFSIIFSFLPKFLQVILINIYVFLTGTERTHINTIIKFINPHALQKVFFMADDEMIKIKQREEAVFRENMDKIKLYYAKSDGWAPVAYCDRLKYDMPGVKAEVCRRGFSHAFVLHASKDVANLIYGWLQESN